MKSKFPIRTCIFCGRKELKQKLLRIACFKGKVELDQEQRLGGRGAYICPQAQCINKLTTPKGVKRLAYGLRCGLNPNQVLAIKQAIEECIKRGSHGTEG